MQDLNRTTSPAETLPIKVLQFGGGNFLRGFIDYFIDIYNKTSHSQLGISVVKVTPRGDYADWRRQDGLYHVLTRGIHDGKLVNEKHLVTSVSEIIHAYNEWDKYLKSAQNPDIEFIISNTTESGLKLSLKDKEMSGTPDSFPAKLTYWLFERFNFFKEENDFGCIIIPCELLNENGQVLKKLILSQAEIWKLGKAFSDWVDTSNIFCNTLVDRIVPGVHASNFETVWKKIGYVDHLVTEGEPYHIFVIEAPSVVEQKLPLHNAGLNVVFTRDLQPYRKKKVRILNGAHTALVPVAYLSGIRTVRDAINENVIYTFLSKLIEEEILPSLDLPKKELTLYAKTIIDRFSNPYIDHYLIDISLNSFSKFKARLLPSLKSYYLKKGELPTLIPFAFTCLILIYKGEYGKETIKLRDEPIVIQKLSELWSGKYRNESIISNVLGWNEFWEMDLTSFKDLQKTMVGHMTSIQNKGMVETLKLLV